MLEHMDAEMADFHDNNRAAAFLQLVKLSKALADAETTIALKPQWEKGYFRKGCILEAMGQYDDALAAFQKALQYNPQSSEVSRKIKMISQLARKMLFTINPQTNCAGIRRFWTSVPMKCFHAYSRKTCRILESF